MIHQEQIDWLLPGVKATNKYIVLPLVTYCNSFKKVTIVKFGAQGELLSKRLYWDQASVLKQLGILPSTMHCRANHSEVSLPVLDARIAKPLQVAADSVPAQPKTNPSMAAGLTSHQANLEYTPRSRRVQSSAMSEIMSENGSVEEIKPSTRIHYQPGGKSSDIFSNEPLPVRTSLSMDPRRYQTQIDLANALPLQQDDTHHKKLFPDSNNVSHISLTNEGPFPVAAMDPVKVMNASKISQESVEDLTGYHGRKLFAGSNDSHISFGNVGADVIAPRVSQRRDPNARSEEHLLGTRPSSR